MASIFPHLKCIRTAQSRVIINRIPIVDNGSGAVFLLAAIASTAALFSFSSSSSGSYSNFRLGTGDRLLDDEVEVDDEEVEELEEDLRLLLDLLYFDLLWSSLRLSLEVERFLRRSLVERDRDLDLCLYFDLLSLPYL